MLGTNRSVEAISEHIMSYQPMLLQYEPSLPYTDNCPLSTTPAKYHIQVFCHMHKSHVHKNVQRFAENLGKKTHRIIIKLTII